MQELDCKTLLANVTIPIYVPTTQPTSTQSTGIITQPILQLTQGFFRYEDDTNSLILFVLSPHNNQFYYHRFSPHGKYLQSLPPSQQDPMIVFYNLIIDTLVDLSRDIKQLKGNLVNLTSYSRTNVYQQQAKKKPANNRSKDDNNESINPHNCPLQPPVIPFLYSTHLQSSNGHNNGQLTITQTDRTYIARFHSSLITAFHKNSLCLELPNNINDDNDDINTIPKLNLIRTTQLQASFSIDLTPCTFGMVTNPFPIMNEPIQQEQQPTKTTKGKTGTKIIIEDDEMITKNYIKSMQLLHNDELLFNLLVFLSTIERHRLCTLQIEQVQQSNQTILTLQKQLQQLQDKVKLLETRQLNPTSHNVDDNGYNIDEQQQQQQEDEVTSHQLAQVQQQLPKGRKIAQVRKNLKRNNQYNSDEEDLF